MILQVSLEFQDVVKLQLSHCHLRDSGSSCVLNTLWPCYPWLIWHCGTKVTANCCQQKAISALWEAASLILCLKCFCFSFPFWHLAFHHWSGSGRSYAPLEAALLEDWSPQLLPSMMAYGAKYWWCRHILVMVVLSYHHHYNKHVTNICTYTPEV